MRKREYDAEKSDKVAIGLIVFMFMVVVVFFACLPQQIRLYGLDKYLAREIIPVLILAGGTGGFGFWLYNRSTKVTRFIKNMMKVGVEYPGVIVAVEEYKIYFRGRNYKNTYAVIVECIIEGRTYRLTSKQLSFDPMDKLASDKCSVYVHDDVYVITGFDYKSRVNDGILFVDRTSFERDEEMTVKYENDFKDCMLK